MNSWHLPLLHHMHDTLIALSTVHRLMLPALGHCNAYPGIARMRPNACLLGGGPLLRLRIDIMLNRMRLRAGFQHCKLRCCKGCCNRGRLRSASKGCSVGWATISDVLHIRHQAFPQCRRFCSRCSLSKMASWAVAGVKAGSRQHAADMQT